MKKIFFEKSVKAFALLVFLGIAFVSCATNNSGDSNSNPGASAPPGENPSVPAATVDFLPDSSNVKLLGRSVVENNQLLMCYSSTGAEFLIKAKHLEVTFSGDSASGSANKDNAARVAVFVNGERMLDQQLTKRKSTFTVFDGVDVVEGVVQVLKISESANSLCSLSAITVDSEGSIQPAPEKSMKIEFIGDSITCGYGIDDPVRSNHFSTSTEDNTKTYAYKTAQQLNADYSMVSISGWGIISGYSGDGNKNESSQLPKYYSKLGFSWGNAINGKKPQDREWDFSKFQPDVVVVNLGTNDHSYTNNKEKRCEEYKSAYVSFIKDIRSKNPDAKIICALGLMGDNLFPYIDKAVEEYKQTTGDTKVSALKFAGQLSSDGICADWHPSEKTNTKAAAALIKHINSLE